MKHENNIHDLLLKHGLTVQQASFLMDTTVSTIYKLKNGDTFPDIKMQLSLQALFGVTLEDVYPQTRIEFSRIYDLIEARRGVL